MENVICHVRFKGLFAKWELGAWLTEQQCDTLGGHQRKFMDTAFPACCCLSPLGPGACAEWKAPYHAESWDKVSIPIWPRISSLVLKEKKKKHPHLTTCMAQTKSSSALPLYLCTPNREIFFPVKVFKSKCYKHFMLIHTAFPVNIYS